MAASSSIAVPIKPRMAAAPCSARTSAAATPTGSARASAMRLVETVPKMPGSAPNSSVTGFQFVPARKPRP
jgi:hypothetical protein